MPLRIAIPVPLPKLFDYAWTADAPEPAPGTRVVVEFGRRQVVAVVVETVAGDSGKLKPVIEALDPAPLFDTALWTLFPRVARYYLAPLGETLATALPVGLRRIEPMVLPERLLYAMSAAGAGAATPRGAARQRLWARLREGPASEADLAAIHARWRPVVTEWKVAGWVDAIARSPYAPPPILAPGPELSPAQAEVLQTLRAHGEGLACSCWKA